MDQEIQNEIQKLESKMAMINWIKSRSLSGHSNICNFEDPDNHGPCNCGYSEDAAIKENLLTLVIKDK
jgi:hypothetical protein